MLTRRIRWCNWRPARAIHDLYDRLKVLAINLTGSRFAPPLLDFMFQQPIFQSNALDRDERMPSRTLILGKLKAAGMLKVLRDGRAACSGLGARRAGEST